MNKKFFKSKEFIIKTIITAIIVLITGLSFLFLSKIEIALGLRKAHGEFEQTEAFVYDSDYFVSFVDVGQGNCTFAKLPDGKTLLIDGGNTMYGDKVKDYLMSMGIETIDYMIATHADSDHIGGLVKVLENFEVKNIFRPFQISGTGSSYATFVPDRTEDLAEVYYYFYNTLGTNSKISRVTSKVYADFLAAAYSETYSKNSTEEKSSITVFYDGLKISGDGYSLEFFAPEVREEKFNLKTKSNTNGFATVGYGANNSNDNSAIFLLECLGSTYLFTGDAAFSNVEDNQAASFEELDFIESLTSSEKNKLSNLSVYMAGHHGSKYSSSIELIGLTNPKFAVISVGKDNNYGHPHTETIQRIYESKRISSDRVFRTDESGTIVFSGENGEVYFAREVTIISDKYATSWLILAIVVSVSIIIVFWSIKPKSKSGKELTPKDN